MSKLTNSFRKLDIFNAYHFAGRGNVYVLFYPRDHIDSSRTRIHRLGYHTDPKGSYRDGFDKYFTGNKEHSLSAAMLWAGQKYGIMNWARTPYGSYMDAEFVKTRMADLREKLKVLEAVGTL